MPLTSRRLKLSKVTGYGTRPGRRRSIKRKARKSRQWLVRRDLPPAKADVPLDELANPVMSGGRTYRDAIDQKRRRAVLISGCFTSGLLRLIGTFDSATGDLKLS